MEVILAGTLVLNPENDLAWFLLVTKLREEGFNPISPNGLNTFRRFKGMPLALENDFPKDSFGKNSKLNTQNSKLPRRSKGLPGRIPLEKTQN